MKVILALLVLACAQDKPEKETPVSFRIVDRNTQSGFKSGTEKFVSSTKDWVAVWIEREEGLKTKRPHPTIDFEKEVVIVVALGMKTAGDYTVEISKIVKTADAITVVVKKTSPPENSKPAAKMSSPFVLARIDKPDRPIIFREEEKAKN